MIGGSSNSTSAAPLKLLVIAASLTSALFVGCATPTGQDSSAQTEICDVVEPPTGSRVIQKIRCEPKKTQSQPTS